MDVWPKIHCFKWMTSNCFVLRNVRLGRFSTKTAVFMPDVNANLLLSRLQCIVSTWVGSILSRSILKECGTQ
jgi:hypothetical protein